MATDLTKYCITRFLSPRYGYYMTGAVEVRRVAADRWHTRIGESDRAILSNHTEEGTRPWTLVSKSYRQHEVCLNNGVLKCSCEVFESTLVPCVELLAVKNGELCLSDFHIRHYATWQAGHIPLSEFPRSFNDGAGGPTPLGVDFNANIQPSWDDHPNDNVEVSVDADGENEDLDMNNEADGECRSN